VTDPALIADAFRAACLDELEAPKPGNVHRFAVGGDTTPADFVRSAEVAASPLCARGRGVGERIADAVDATWNAVATNTNLGIVLLCAPLAAAAETTTETTGENLRPALEAVLQGLDVVDAAGAFAAIVKASPAGLGHADRYDVFAPPTVGLREAMAAAADRDRIARQYTSVFEDVFAHGEPRLQASLQQLGEPPWATLAVYLGFLAAFPDSHILRKHGQARAQEVRDAALAFHTRLERGESPEAFLDELLAFDAALKRCRVNPGTSADLTVATLFVHRLRKILPSARNSG